MYKDCILKAVHSYDVRRTHVFHLSNSHCLSSSFSRKVKKVRACCRHQGCAWKCKSKCLCHDLHGRCSSDKGTCSTAWACIAFCPVKLLFINFATLIFCAVHSKLLQCQHFRSGIHGSTWNKYGRNVYSGKSHQISRNTFVTA